MALLGNVYWWSYKVFPEIGMVAFSQCNTPVPGWSGRIWGVQVWSNPESLDHWNESFDVRSESSFIRRLQDAPVKSGTSSATSHKQRDIIIIASHHKTGTYLGQKIYSRICAVMRWCCVFHVTSDSLVAVKHSLETEPVNLVSHTQWAWNPDDIGPNYRFIHFYRNPLAKIASGYRYHMDGVEGWSTRPQKYGQACSAPQALTGSTHEKSPFTSKSDVFKFCQSPHLCEACCRSEHEVRFSPHHHLLYQNSHGVDSVQNGEQKNSVYVTRPKREYDFMCQNLKGVNVSLMDSLKTLPIDAGVRLEAAVDYYENLRMARIVNHTYHDSRSLNIDLDFFMDNYELSVRLMLSHINLPLSEKEIESLVEELKFFDIESSPIYRLSMSNPLMNHINQNADGEKEAIRQVLQNDAAIKEMYHPVLELLGGSNMDNSGSTGFTRAMAKVKKVNPAVAKNKNSRSTRFLRDSELMA